METMALRQALLTRLGHFPQRVPLTPTIGLRFDEGAYTRALVTYGVEAGERVSAWLLMPQGAAHQTAGPHSWRSISMTITMTWAKLSQTGLVGNAMYAYGQDICHRGYVVLCPDLLCFEDRRPAYEVRQANRMDDAGYERFEFTKRLLAGSCLQTKYLHDLTCAVDVLASLPGVNRERLGVIGHSLGGLEALWLCGMTYASLRQSLPAALDYCAPWYVMASIMASRRMFLVS